MSGSGSNGQERSGGSGSVASGSVAAIGKAIRGGRDGSAPSGDSGAPASADGGGAPGRTDGEGTLGVDGSTPLLPQPPATHVECPEIGLDPSVGKTYFVCDCGVGAASGCVAGADSNVGSKESPFKSYEKARTVFGKLAAGESIAFCRGGVFAVDGRSGTEWVNAQCKADKPCVVRDYKPIDSAPDVERPKLAFKDRYGFDFQNGGNSEHEEGYVFLNLVLTGTQVGKGFFFFNDIDDVLLCNLVIDGFEIAVNISGSNPAGAGSDGLNERIVLRNSVVTNCPQQGYLGGGNGCAVEYCSFRNNGFAKASFNHNIYLSGQNGGAARGMRAVGNDLYQSAMIDGKCTGVSLVVHGKQEGLLIDGNTVREDVNGAGPGCWGIAMDTGYDEAEYFHNVTIQNNVIINVGNIGIGLNACTKCVVQNNIIVSDQPAFGTLAINIPDRDGAANDEPLDQVTVRNNSIYFGANTQGTGITLEGQGAGHSVTGNAVHYAGSTAGFGCLALGLAASAYDAVDHNLCFAPNSSGAEWEKGSGNLSAWTASSGFDTNSQWADPLFTMPTAATPDLTPGTRSPLIGKDDPTRSPAFDQQAKDRGASPSIGALEP